MALNLLQVVFFIGQLAAIALLVYGAWLCIGAQRKQPRPGAAPAPEEAPAAAPAAGPRKGGAWA